MKILQNQMKQASFVRNRWAVVAAVGTDPNTLLDAETYAHIASMLRGGDIIEVVPVDRSWFAEVYLTSVKGFDVRTKLLRLVKFDAKEEAAAPKEPEKKAEDFGPGPSNEDAKYTLIQYGRGGKHRVVRVSDGVVMKDDLTKEEAEEFIKELP